MNSFVDEAFTSGTKGTEPEGLEMPLPPEVVYSIMRIATAVPEMFEHGLRYIIKLPFCLYALLNLLNRLFY